MASFFIDAEKAEMSELIVNVAETFERDIIVYKSPEKMIIYSEVEFDRFSANDQNNLNNPLNSFQKFVIKARVLYSKQMKDELLKPYGNSDDAQIKVPFPDASVRIKVNPAGYEIMKEAREIEFDNFRFSVSSPERPHGLFTTQYYTFYLTLLK
jgi:hypothetical protein